MSIYQHIKKRKKENKMSVISWDDLEVHVRAVVKSNIISLGLTPTDIEKVAIELSKDVMDVFDHYIVMQEGN